MKFVHHILNHILISFLSSYFYFIIYLHYIILIIVCNLSSIIFIGLKYVLILHKKRRLSPSFCECFFIFFYRGCRHRQHIYRIPPLLLFFQIIINFYIFLPFLDLFFYPGSHVANPVFSMVISILESSSTQHVWLLSCRFSLPTL